MSHYQNRYQGSNFTMPGGGAANQNSSPGGWRNQPPARAQGGAYSSHGGQNPSYTGQQNAAGNRNERPHVNQQNDGMNRNEPAHPGQQNADMDRNEPTQKVSLKPKDIEVLEREIMNKATCMDDVQEICRAQARFQHFVKSKGFAQAKKTMGKKPKQYCQGRPFSCQTCEEYYPSKHELDNHLKGFPHKEICRIYSELEDIGESIFSKKKVKDVNEGQPRQQLNNSRNEPPNQPPSDDQHKRTSDTPKIPPMAPAPPYKDGSMNKLREDILSLEPLTMEKEDFILAAYEKVMSEYWPLPNTDHYCRCCNYTQFKTEAQLNTHTKSARHLDYERNYGLAFCLSCQFHTGDEEGMHVHLQSARHIEIQNMMDATRLEALRIWEEIQLKNQVSGQQPPQDLTAATVPPAAGEQPARSADQGKPIQAVAVPVPQVDVTGVVKDSPKTVEGEEKGKEKKDSTPRNRNDRGGKGDEGSRGRMDRRSGRDRDGKSDRGGGGRDKEDRGRDRSARERSREHKKDDEKKDDKKKKEDLKKGEKARDRKRSRSKEKTDDKKKSATEERGKKPTTTAAAADSTADAPVPDVIIVEPIVIEKTPKEIIEDDSFVIPLPGYMCTVCAETLPNESLAVAHIKSEQHAPKVLAHKKKLGLPAEDVKSAPVAKPEINQPNGDNSPAAKRRADPLSRGNDSPAGKPEMKKDPPTFTPPWHTKSPANDPTKKDPYRQSGSAPRPPTSAPPDEQPLLQQMRDRDADIQRQQQQHVKQNYNLNKHDDGSPQGMARPPAEAVAKAPVMAGFQHSNVVSHYGGQPSANPYTTPKQQPQSNSPFMRGSPQQYPSSQPLKKQGDLWNSATKSAPRQNKQAYNRGLRGSRY